MELSYRNGAGETTTGLLNFKSWTRPFHVYFTASAYNP